MVEDAQEADEQPNYLVFQAVMVAVAVGLVRPLDSLAENLVEALPYVSNTNPALDDTYLPTCPLSGLQRKCPTNASAMANDLPNR